jgi:Anti-sigma-K factor rskA/Putative zinc-finger
VGRALTHEELSELIGAFALDAVDPDESEAVETHVAECPRCRQVLSQRQQVAAALGNAGGPAPPGLWDAIEVAIRSQPVERPPDRTLSKRGPADQSASVISHPTLAPMPRVRRLSAAARAGAVLGAAAAAAAIALLGIQVGHLNHKVDQSNRGTPNLQAAAEQALGNPADTRIMMTATHGSARQVAEIVITKSGASFLFNRDLPRLPPNRTYQLWAVIHGQAISAGLLGTDPETGVFTLNPAELTTTFELTDEPAPGSPNPTSPPVASTALRVKTPNISGK